MKRRRTWRDAAESLGSLGPAGIVAILVSSVSLSCGGHSENRVELQPTPAGGEGAELAGEVWMTRKQESLAVYAKLENRGTAVARVSTNADFPLGLEFYDSEGERFRSPPGVPVAITLAEGIYHIPPGEEVVIRDDHYYSYLASICLPPGDYWVQVIFRIRSPALEDPSPGSLRFGPFSFTEDELTGPRHRNCDA